MVGDTLTLDHEKMFEFTEMDHSDSVMTEGHWALIDQVIEEDLRISEQQKVTDEPMKIFNEAET